MSTVTTTPTTPRTAPSRAHAPRRGPAAFARDTGIVLVRELRPVLHDPFSVLFGLVQPIVFLALFGPLLVGSLGGTRPARRSWAATSGSGSCRRSSS